MKVSYIYIVGLCACHASHVCADVQVFGNDERDDWFDAVGGPANVTTVGFSGYPDNTPVVDQWSHLGVTFPGFDVISGESFFLFPQDGWGLQGFSEVNIEFSQPMSWIAIDFPGGLGIELYDNETLIHTSTLGASGIGLFGGLTSDQPFDRARLFDPFSNSVSIDDLHFGPPIPAPPAVAPLAFVLLARQSRRRRP